MPAEPRGLRTGHGVLFSEPSAFRPRRLAHVDGEREAADHPPVRRPLLLPVLCSQE